MVAVTYKAKRQISIGYNAYPSRRGGETLHPSYAGIGTHAELDALSKTSVGSVLYLAGVNHNDTDIVSTPCPRCTRILRDSGIKHVVYYDGTKLVKEHVGNLLCLPIPTYNYGTQKRN